MDTINQLIERLQKKADKIGGDTPIVLWDELSFYENDFIHSDDFYLTAIVEEAVTRTGEKILLISGGSPCIDQIRKI